MLELKAFWYIILQPKGLLTHCYSNHNHFRYKVYREGLSLTSTKSIFVEFCQVFTYVWVMCIYIFSCVGGCCVTSTSFGDWCAYQSLFSCSKEMFSKMEVIGQVGCLDVIM